MPTPTGLDVLTLTHAPSRAGDAMYTIPANDLGDTDDARPTVAAAELHAYRVLMKLPETLRYQLTESARASGRDANELYQNALTAFARSLACGVRLPLSASGSNLVGVNIKLPTERLRWLRRTASRLSLSESDLVSSAVAWWLAGGSAPTPEVVIDRSRQPTSTHDPPG